ncbi:unnamed protein product [Mytilus coruscus]|uniref:LRAT domain-containing protein n=1 Tax=Mytilus coruscus TaxID=42192 RepID=A0A6J8AWN2_MYTCO|nr:unnamed protein product [Mytilus coruscus]
MSYYDYFPIEKNKIDSCKSCVRQIPIEKSKQVRVGDHIILRSVQCDHHLIIVEKHNSNSHCVQVTAIHSYPDSKNLKSLHRETKKIPLDGSALVVSYRFPMFSRDEIVRRAEKRLTNNDTGSNEIYEYNLATSNCEHFATWCVTNRYFSFQVLQFNTSFGFLHAPALKIMHNNRELCDSCYGGLLQTVLSVPWKHVRPKDVNKGDIVSYFYYMLWHDAVVMEVKSDNKLVLAHYGVGSLFHFKKIIKQTVRFKDHEYLTVYKYDGWNVYSPAEVVERAESRLGEEKWSLTSNRSSHFAKWCKVKMAEF